MEIWDILDEHGNKTGRFAVRGEALASGEYILAVHVYIRNSKGEYLIQKRSMKKQILPGIWDITGGVVIAGEDNIHAAIREVKEEVGIILERDQMNLIGRLKRKNTFIDIWLAKANFDIDDCILQEDEVDDVMLVSSDKLINMVFEADYRDDDYRELIKNYISYLDKRSD